MEELEIESQDEVMVLTFVTVHPDMEKTTANLVGPVIINLKTSKAQQIVLEEIDTNYVRFNIWKGMQSVGIIDPSEEASAVS